MKKNILTSNLSVTENWI